MIRRSKHTPGLLVTQKHGMDILQDPLLNKGTAFPLTERDRLGIRGLLPPRQVPVEIQVNRTMRAFDQIESPLAKWEFLTALQDRNESLFYKLLTEKIEELAPIVYTPTVGQACRLFSQIWRKPRGLFISVEDRSLDDMRAIIHNWPRDEVDIIVVTDGSRILGLGDLGVCGHAIPIGKLALYVAAGGIAPHRVLPITIDVGTNNKELLDDPLYLGLQRPRTSGSHYFELMDSFMTAVRERWPHVVVQFEDFSNIHARILLDKYRDRHLCFNDDIMGTGAMTVAGIINALRTQGVDPKRDFAKQRIVCVGAGSAGIGVVDALANAMRKVSNGSILLREAQSRFALLDKNGLLTTDRSDLADEQRPYAVQPNGKVREGMPLLDVIKELKPSILLGVSGVGGIFTEDIVREMAKNNPRPIIFPLSNPTTHAECTAEQAFRWTEGRVVFASGSPFEPLMLEDGVTYCPNQGNNMYIFPGLGLGSVICKARIITDNMLHAASMSLVRCVSEEDLRRGVIYPKVRYIREVSKNIAVAVVEQAIADGVARMDSLEEGKTIEECVESFMWAPRYSSILYQPVGHSV